MILPPNLPMVTPLVLPQSISLASNLVPGSSGGAAAPLLTDLVAYWNLDEASGNRADSGPNGYTLTDVNTVGSRTGEGGAGTAADFVAANTEYLTVTGNSDLRGAIGQAWSMFFWFIVDDLTAQRELIATLASGGVSGYDVFASSGQMRFRARADAFTQLIMPGVSTGAWTAIYVAYNGSDTLTASQNDGTPITQAISGDFVPGSESFQLGANRGTLTHEGGLQCVGRWNRELTAAEITYLAGDARLYSDLSGFTG